ncbi:unnamed protein product [Calypogeia fissa]
MYLTQPRQGWNLAVVEVAGRVSSVLGDRSAANKGHVCALGRGGDGGITMLELQGRRVVVARGRHGRGDGVQLVISSARRGGVLRV